MPAPHPPEFRQRTVELGIDASQAGESYGLEWV